MQDWIHTAVQEVNDEKCQFITILQVNTNSLECPLFKIEEQSQTKYCQEERLPRRSKGSNFNPTAVTNRCFPSKIR